MANLIDGRAVSAHIREKIKKEVAEFVEATGVTPALAVILVGDDPASAVYVRNKHRGCLECDMRSLEYTLPASATEEEVLSLIDRLNNDSTVHGILVQLPLPKHISEEKITRRILPEKDVDAFHPENVGKIMMGKATLLPCTPAGIMELLAFYGIDPEGKHCVVVGRSNIVGKPMLHLMLEKNATVTVCHSRTKELSSYTKNADILVVAVGRAGFVTADMVKPGAVVIDVGINRLESGKLSGDVAFDECAEVASYITPVPGGVGPMTISMLLSNTLSAAKSQVC